MFTVIKGIVHIKINSWKCAHAQAIQNVDEFVSSSDLEKCVIASLMDWSGVDYCDVFISCLDSHSDGTHSLQSIHCWDTDAETHFYKPDEETNSS